MERYQVIFEHEAQEEALDAASFIARMAPLNAQRWYRGLEKAIESLEFMPSRCAIAPESHYLDIELRNYIYKSHRIIFRVMEDQKVVRVLHVRHAKRRALGEPDE